MNEREQEGIFSKKLNALTAWRFIMIVIIVCYHFEFLGNGIDTGTGISHTGNFFDYHFHNAHIGVDFFFIMSGFGLAYSSFLKKIPPLATRWSPVKAYAYAKSKVQKIWKWYLLSMALGVPYVIYVSIKAHGILKGILLTAIKAGLGLSLLQSGTACTSFDHLFNGVCWFLSTIFILYMIYPLLYKLNEKIRNSRKLVCMGLILTIAGYEAFHILFEQITESIPVLDDLAFGSPYIRIFQLISGILLCDGFILAKKNKKQGKIPASLEVILTVVFIIWFFFGNSVYYGQFQDARDLADVILALLIVYVFAFECGPVSRMLNGKIPVLLGNVAMYIFLIHYPIRIISWSLLEYLAGNGLMSKVFTCVLTVAATCVMTYFMYWYDQREVLTQKQNKSSKKGK